MGGKKQTLRFIPAQTIARLVLNLRMPDDAVRRILTVALLGGDDATDLPPAEEVIASAILDEIASYDAQYRHRVDLHRKAQKAYRERLFNKVTDSDEPNESVTIGDNHGQSPIVGDEIGRGTERNGTDVPNIRGTVSPPPPEGENRVTITSTRFKVPSQQEVAEFFESRGGSAGDAERFHDHYTANGWRVGRAAMKDWRAAARNWMRSDSFGPGGGAVPAKKEAAAPAQDGAYPVVLSPEERWGAKKEVGAE